MNDRKRMPAIFLWIPLIISLVGDLLIIILKISEKSIDSFLSWNATIWYMILIPFVSFGLSLIIHLVVNLQNRRLDDEKPNLREFCDNEIRKELRNRTGYNLSDFTETAESMEGSGHFGKEHTELVYWHLYRINKGSKKRYVLGLMSMQKGREDERIILQSPYNFVNLDEILDNFAEKLAKSKMNYAEHEDVFMDKVTGRQEIKKSRTPVFDQKVKDDDEESVEVPA